MLVWWIIQVSIYIHNLRPNQEQLWKPHTEDPRLHFSQLSWLGLNPLSASALPLTSKTVLF